MSVEDLERDRQISRYTWRAWIRQGRLPGRGAEPGWGAVSVLDAALAYLARGWSVIPTARETKRPLVAWREFQDRAPTAGELRAWWAGWPYPTILRALETGRHP